MNTYWVTAHPGGQSGHNTEQQAEAKARDLINSKTATQVVVYPIDMEGDQ